MRLKSAKLVTSELFPVTVKAQKTNKKTNKTKAKSYGYEADWETYNSKQKGEDYQIISYQLHVTKIPQTANLCQNIAGFLSVISQNLIGIINLLVTSYI